MLLPAVTDLDTYRRIFPHPQTWLPAMRVICQRHGLDAADLRMAPPGSNPVFRTGRVYIKLFAPLWQSDFAVERCVLEWLPRRLPVDFPQLAASGEIEGWGYLILSEVPGVPLEEVWHQLRSPEQQRVAYQCGELLAVLHQLEPDGLELIQTDWAAFLYARRETLLNRCREEYSDPWSDEIPDFLIQNNPAALPPSARRFLLADLTEEHALLQRGEHGWNLTGYVDFGDCMLGDPLYDFVAPSVGITRSRADAQRALFLGYGYPEAHLTPQFANALFAQTLLHQFIEVPELLPLFEQAPQNLAQLKRQLWYFAA